MNTTKIIENRLLLIAKFLEDPYKDSHTKYDLITEVMQGEHDIVEPEKVPDNVVGESDKKFTKEDLMGDGKRIIYLGHFDNWDEWQSWISCHFMEAHTAYVFRKTDSGQFFGRLKDGCIGDVSDFIQDILRKEYGDI